MKKIVVIGGGPGGYVAAIRAAQLGAEVVLVEKEHMGGTCLNVGCIPTKALLESAHTFYEAGNSEKIGVLAKPVLDWAKVQERREEVIKKLVSGVEGLMRTNKIKVIRGKASFLDKNTISVKKENGETESVKSDYFIIATGSVTATPPIPGVNEPFCIDSTDALSLSTVPASMVVIGGGVIGVELATAYHSFGTKVTIVEMMQNILPNMDKELSEKLKKDMKQRGIEILTGTKVCRIEKEAGQGCCVIESDGKQQRLQAEKVLVCVGRKANLEGLDLEKAGIQADRVIPVDDKLCTNVKHIYAIGDCNGKMMLAHAASEQGIVAVENCMGEERYYDNLCPSGVYSVPEIAGVGITEDQAKEKKIAYKKGVFPMAANGRAMILRQETGLVKVLIGEKYGEVLGVHMYGPMATELIQEAALAMKMEATADEIIDTIHAHPTVSECLHEAVLAANKRAIHIPNRK